MNLPLTQISRLAVSPYARRLARERSLPLGALRGSGPGGRILAADVLGFVPGAALVDQAAIAGVEPPVAAVPVATPRVAALATSVALNALRDLLSALENTGKAFDIDDVIMRAAGRAFAQAPDIAKGADVAVALELTGRQAVFATTPEKTLTSLRAARLAALTDNCDEADHPAVLSLRMLPASDIRPVMIPLLPHRAMRMAVSLNASGDHADCLLVVDAASVDEVGATAWLSALKSAIEHPLRLLV